MTLCILGRQPAIGLAELQALYGADRVRLIAPTVASVDVDNIDGKRLGGVQKTAELIDTYDTNNWRAASERAVRSLLSEVTEKITLGVSAYHFPVSARDVQKTGLVFKRKVKDKKGINIRLVPNTLAALNTAQVLHNKLTRPGKWELIIVLGDDGKTYVGKTDYVQDIEAYTFRDRGRPRRDAHVGMLPPKLAQIMINLTGGSEALSVFEGSTFPVERAKTNNPMAASAPEKTDKEEHGDTNSASEAIRANEEDEVAPPRLLDPFCGTGVVLQEAALMGYAVYGTDLSERMIRYTRDNLVWLSDTHHVWVDKYFHVADAQDASWQQPVDVVVCEGYLGKPLTTTPDREKLEHIVHESNSIMKNFLQNIAPQLKQGTPLCIAAPAWHIQGNVRHLPVIADLEKIGFERRKFPGITDEELIYHREDQIVGRELLVLSKK